MSEKVNRNETQENTELADETLEKASGGTEIRKPDEPSLTDDRPTEEVAFYYNKIAYSYAQTKGGKKWHD